MEQTLPNFLLPYAGQWGYVALFLLTFLETSAFLGFLVPGESMVVIAGLLASQHVLALGPVVSIASLGAICGDTVGYWLGARFGEGFFLHYGQYVFFKKEYLDEARGFFIAHGGKTVFFGRFMAWLRAFAPVIAGIAHMPYRTFFLFNVAGGIVWATVFSLLGYFVGNSWDTVKVYLDRAGLLAVVVGMLALYGYFLFTKKKRLLREHVGWIDRRLAAQLPRTWAFVKGRFAAGRWYGLQLTAALILLLLAVSAFAEIVEDLVDKETLFRLDFTLQQALGAYNRPGVIRIMVDFTNWGGVYLVWGTIAALGVVVVRRSAWWDAFALGLAAAGGEGVLNLLKVYFHRPRPTSPLVLAHGYSFPSGHAFGATIAYGALLYFTVKSTNNPVLNVIASVAAIFLILFVGVSRLSLNVHWLTDVLAGYAAGTAWLVFSIVVANTLQAMIRPPTLNEDQGKKQRL